MTRHTKSDVAKEISDLKTTDSGDELRQNVPVSTVEDWLQKTGADPSQYSSLLTVEGEL